MNSPTLLAVAHGSKHHAATATIRALAGEVERLAPVLDIQVAFVQHAEPSLPHALDAAGPDVVIVPLLLSTGYHLTTDIAGAVTAIDTAITAGDAPAPRVAGPLGPDPLLVTALTGRLAEAEVPAGTPVVLAAAGSSDPLAAGQVQAQADLLAADLGVPVAVGYAAAGQPTVGDAVAALRARTGKPVAVASYLLAPGQFQDKLGQAGADWVTMPLGAHPAVAALIIDRYRAHRTPVGRAA
ncbi:MAG TPA: sirohydrochlorin chelatase [Streptosporangiaceae bacterium]|nr:sirohydrochlorin chelatase [Streptosporangiaceae bacterium]